MIELLSFKDAAIDGLLIEVVAVDDVSYILKVEDHNDEDLYEEHLQRDQVTTLKAMIETEQYEDPFLTGWFDLVQIAIRSTIESLFVVKQWISATSQCACDKILYWPSSSDPGDLMVDRAYE